jgi:hypothetical protein
MKIAVVATKNIPSQWAHSINTMKHANGFYKLNNSVEILTGQHFSELKARIKFRDVHSFYDINNKIRIRFFNDNLFNYFEHIG